MYLLKFPMHPGTYFYSDADFDRAENFITVLDCVMTLFDRYVPGVPGQPLNIKIERSGESPACYRNLREIHLNTELRYISQAAYQFAHELCHMRIPFFVGEDLRWFEESVCEMASHFSSGSFPLNSQMKNTTTTPLCKDTLTNSVSTPRRSLKARRR